MAHREFSSVLSDDLEKWDWQGKEVQEEGDICIYLLYIIYLYIYTHTK